MNINKRFRSFTGGMGPGAVALLALMALVLPIALDGRDEETTLLIVVALAAVVMCVIVLVRGPTRRQRRYDDA